VRARLWHTPAWTEYSTLDDVIRSLQRANALGMDVLLDFHYSDTWADPAKQIIPAAWAQIADVHLLERAVYDYTLDVLLRLDHAHLMPEFVQVGNQINTEILMPAAYDGAPIRWERNASLINAGLRAIRDAGKQARTPPHVMLHIAQPENIMPWFDDALAAGIHDFDVIGMSYYPKWSTFSIRQAGETLGAARERYGKEVMNVETAYPWTLDGVNESASNILNSDFLVEGYPATPDLQRQFLIDLAQTVFANAGLGIVYWEPAWVSTPCRTLWGQGSHWENATSFDFHNENEVLPGIEFFQYPYDYPVEVNLSFSFEGQESPEEIFFWGDFTGMGRRLMLLTPSNGEYVLHTRLLPGSEIQYQFYAGLLTSPETTLLPANCMDDEGLTSVTIPDSDVTIHQTNISCPALPDTG
jgi:arabinogalactan endo-1,4-beta-galactosidase